jgi:glycosyltransferase involved in cell wall biosynthesis
VLTPSRTVRTHVWELGASEDQVRVVPNGIEFDAIRSVEPDGDAEIVVSRELDGAANLESVLLALAEFRKYDWQATVVGDGPARAGYERQARDLSVGDRVEFVGECDREERIEIYRGARTFIQTAKRAHFAEELLRALACGCVGVVEYQADSSAHELVERRERGIRVTDMEALDEAIEASWEREFRDLDRDFEAFDHEAVTRRYLDIFRECGVDA